MATDQTTSSMMAGLYKGDQKKEEKRMGYTLVVHTSESSWLDHLRNRLCEDDGRCLSEGIPISPASSSSGREAVVLMFVMSVFWTRLMVDLASQLRAVRDVPRTLKISWSQGLSLNACELLCSKYFQDWLVARHQHPAPLHWD